MSRRTAVAAPAAEPFDELFTAIDRMDGAELRRFLAALRERFGPIPEPAVTHYITVDAKTYLNMAAAPLPKDWEGRYS